MAKKKNHDEQNVVRVTTHHGCTVEWGFMDGDEFVPDGKEYELAGHDSVAVLSAAGFVPVEGLDLPSRKRGRRG